MNAVRVQVDGPRLVETSRAVLRALVAALVKVASVSHACLVSGPLLARAVALSVLLDATALVAKANAGSVPLVALPTTAVLKNARIVTSATAPSQALAGVLPALLARITTRRAAIVARAPRASMLK